MTGFATSVIGCGCEAGIDRELTPRETPDGRPGVRVLLFAVVHQRIAEAAAEPGRPMRADQPGLRLLRRACRAKRRSSSAMRCATSAMAGRSPRSFGGKHYWRVPVMDGEFVCEATTGTDQERGRRRQPADHGRGAQRRRCAAAEAAVAAIDAGAGRDHAVSRRHRALGLESRLEIQGACASTNDAYCPTLRGAVKSALGPEIGSRARNRHRRLDVDGGRARRCAPASPPIIKLGPKRGALRIGAGNYGGKLGPHHFHLKDLLPMKPLVLTLRDRPRRAARPFAAGPTPLVRTRRPPRSRKLELQTGRQRITVGDIFRVRGGDPQRVRIEGGTRSPRSGRAGHGRRRDRGRRRCRQPGRPLDDGRSSDHQWQCGAVGRFRHAGRTDGNHAARPAIGSAARWPAKSRECAAASWWSEATSASAPAIVCAAAPSSWKVGPAPTPAAA